VNGWILNDGKSRYLNGPQPGRLRNRLLELDGYEKIVSNWTVKKMSSRTGRLMLVGTQFRLRWNRLARVKLVWLQEDKCIRLS